MSGLPINDDPPPNFNPYDSPRGELRPSSEKDYGRGPLWLLFSLRGRIRRTTYWLYLLPVVIVYFRGASLLRPFLVTAERNGVPASVVTVAWVFVFFWIALALQTKRLHDCNKSGWWASFWLVPIVGPICLIAVLSCLRGTIGDNHFGPDPLARPVEPGIGPSYQ